MEEKFIKIPTTQQLISMQNKNLHCQIDDLLVRISILYITSLLLGVGHLHAQDNDTTAKLALLEQMVLFNNARNDFYNSAGLKTWQSEFSYSSIKVDYFNNNSDTYLPQSGSGSKGFTVTSNSFKKLQTNLTLWGSASYENKKIRKISYNESLDYDIIYPYAMVDTVGGDLSSETYYFNGGLLKSFKKINIGFEGAYTGALAYRQRDPRPENTSSKIDVSLALSKEMYRDYVLAVDLKGSTYHQKNLLRFASNLGAPNIYHDAGLGAYNDLLDGTNMGSIFNGDNKGVLLSFAPENRQGIMFTAGFDQLVIRKRLNSVVANIGKLTENKFHAAIGYLLQHDETSYLFKIFGSVKQRESLEANFSNRGSSIGLVKISESKRFTHDEAEAGIEINGQRSLNKQQLSVLIRSFVTENNFKYINPNRKLDATNWVNLLQLNYLVPLKNNLLTTSVWFDYHRNMKTSHYWPDVNQGHTFYNMLNQMQAYYSREFYGLGASVRMDIPTKNQLGLFVQMQGGYKNFQPALNGDAHTLKLSAGVTF
ncbi:MAG: hypothetical protein QM727_15605 [Niabella sp.]